MMKHTICIQSIGHPPGGQMVARDIGIKILPSRSFHPDEQTLFGRCIDRKPIKLYYSCNYTCHIEHSHYKFDGPLYKHRL